MMSAHSKKARVLIVDDVMFNIKILMDTLTEAGYETDYAMNGEEAVVKTADQNYDLILLDVMMPGIDGYDTCKALRKEKKTKDIPIVFLTAKGDTDSKIKGFEVGGQDYLTRPFNKPELLARVGSLINLKLHKDSVLQTNHKLEFANRMLEEANEIKNSFISILAHDLGNPITAILMNLQLLENESYGELNDRQNKAIENLIANMNRIEKLRVDTLDISKMDMGGMVFNKKNTSLKDIVRGSVRDMVPLASEKDIRFQIEIPDDVEAYVDPDRIRQVLDNYLSNAIRYSSNGTEVEISLVEDGTYHVLSVKDQGRGIPPGELEKVFDRFYRVGKKVEGSTGLGLAIVKGIAEGHGGRAWVLSDGEDKGSTFYISIPK